MTHAQTETLTAGAELVLIALLVFMTEAVEVLEGTRKWAVLCADNSVVLPMLGEKSVAHVITDPPYEAEAHTLARRIGKGGRGEFAGSTEYAIDFGAITEEGRNESALHAVRISRGWILAFCQIEAIAAWRSVLVAAGAKWARGQVWVKPCAAPQFTGDRPGMGHESIATAWSGTGRMRWNGGGRHGVYVVPVSQDRTGGAREHPTVKPLPLMLDLVELFTDPDEVVLDPFAGSGTTGVACLRLGRRFIGIEKSPEYAAIARERLVAESKGLTLRDARAGQQSLFGDAR